MQTNTESAKPLVIRSRAKAEIALREVLEKYPASIIGSARNWRIEGHYYAHGKSVRVHCFLGQDGFMHEIRREEVAA